MMRKATRSYPRRSSESYGECVENNKRRRALCARSPLDLESRLFFDRVLSIRKIRELVFITKGKTKGR